MEALTRLVADSLARHGLDRPVDPRRLQWSRWFRCDSPRSLLTVPSKPGIFAFAEEVVNLGATNNHVGAATPGCPAEQSSAEVRRMLAVLQFAEDDDMAFVLDRMFTRINPMRERLTSGHCFLRFVVIEDQEQRRGICAALNQWMRSSAEKATGIGADFPSSLEFAASTDRVDTARVSTVRVGRTLLSDSADSIAKSAQAPLPKPDSLSAALDSGSAKNLHCPQPLPSGF
jgi:hypothetical protein